MKGKTIGIDATTLEANDRVRISMRLAVSGARTCAGTRTCCERLLVHAGAFNLGLWMRTLFGVGTPRGLQGRLAALDAVLSALCSLTGEAIALIAIQINRRAGSVRRLNTIRRLSLKTPLVPRAARPPTGLGSNGSPKPPKHRVNDGLADTSKQDESTT